jgi:hypothetical protein
MVPRPDVTDKRRIDEITSIAKLGAGITFGDKGVKPHVPGQTVANNWGILEIRGTV